MQCHKSHDVQIRNLSAMFTGFSQLIPIHEYAEDSDAKESQAESSITYANVGVPDASVSISSQATHKTTQSIEKGPILIDLTDSIPKQTILRAANDYPHLIMAAEQKKPKSSPSNNLEAEKSWLDSRPLSSSGKKLKQTTLTMVRKQNN